MGSSNLMVLLYKYSRLDYTGIHSWFTNSFYYSHSIYNLVSLYMSRALIQSDSNSARCSNNSFFHKFFPPTLPYIKVILYLISLVKAISMSMLQFILVCLFVRGRLFGWWEPSSNLCMVWQWLSSWRGSIGPQASPIPPNLKVSLCILCRILENFKIKFYNYSSCFSGLGIVRVWKSF